MRTGSAFIGIAMGLSLAVKIGLRWRSYSIASRDNFGKKPCKVTVVRDGERFQITENLIKVGDILFIDFS